MIKQYLASKFKLGRLYNSWLIAANDTVTALEDLNDFINSFLLIGDIPLEAHPDYKFIEREKSATVNTKNISVDQIRELTEFLNKTPSIGPYKVAIIYQSDLMNVNAANSCLKLLEDTAKNTYIFLIATRASSLLPTIRSRCAKINYRSDDTHLVDDIYVKFITLIANGHNIDTKLEFLKELSDKNRSLWSEFSDNILDLMNKLIKKSAGIDTKLSSLELEIMAKLYPNSPEYLIGKYKKIKNLIDNTIKYDLDLKTSYLLIIDHFNCH